MGLFDKLNARTMLTPEERRKRSHDIIKKMGIVCCEDLWLTAPSSEVQIKSKDEICKRAVACLISVQLACSIAQGDAYDTARNMALEALMRYDAAENLLPKEKKLFYDDQIVKQDVIDIVWEYETYWALIWALKLISDKEMNPPVKTCNCERAIAILFSTSKDYSFFKDISKLRGTEAILNMVDLYYRYHWACVEKRRNPEVNIGKLQPEVVLERRRGLEWLICEEKDWFAISLDT